MSSSSKPDKKTRLRDLEMDVEACIACPYSAVRRTPICGAGEPLSPLLIVGDASREADDVEGAPFVGRAGERLDRMLKAATLNPKQVYKTYAVKCFPGREPEFKPHHAASACRKHLVKQLEIMQPRAVVLCGFKTLNWLLLRWSSEKQVDEHTFNPWVGPALVFREVWGPVRFFVIHSPAQLARVRSPGDEARSIEVLAFVKDYVKGQQTGQKVVPDTIELTKKRASNTNQLTFDWRLPISQPEPDRATDSQDSPNPSA